MPTKDPDTVDSAEPSNVAEYVAGAEDWNTLVSSADEVMGHELLAGEAADKLIGVPFVITRVVFRDGVQRKGSPYRDDYVSCEAVVAPLNVLQQKQQRGKLIDPTSGAKLTVADLPVDPDEHIVFNDGSTGIFRQIVMYLAAKQLITLPENLPTTGGKGESRYDLPRVEWLSGSGAGTEGIAIRLFCPRGLRYSDYHNDYTEEGRTRYIA